MNNQELAQHWNCSLDDVARISQFMNQEFRLKIYHQEDEDRYYGVLYRVLDRWLGMDIVARVLTKEGCKTEEEAVKETNKNINDVKLLESWAKDHNVPTDAMKVLERLELPLPPERRARQVRTPSSDLEHEQKS